MHHTAYIDDLKVPRWLILAGGTFLLFGMVHILFRRAANRDSKSPPDGGNSASISADLSTSTISSGSVPSEPNP
jgi:hypothetical protein